MSSEKKRKEESSVGWVGSDASCGLRSETWSGSLRSGQNQKLPGAFGEGLLFLALAVK